MNLNSMHPADQLVEIMNRIYKMGMTTTSGGNLSIRDENGDIWITPSGIDKGSLTRADIMQVKPDGSWIGPHKPSVELPIHTYIYRARPDLNGIVHAHPPAPVAFSLTKCVPDTAVCPEAAHLCGKMAVVGYNPPGENQLGLDVAEKFAQGYDAALMVNHGIVCGARDFHSAFMAFEAATSAARTQLNAMKLGGARILNEEELARALHEEELAPVQAGRTVSSAEKAARRDLCAFARRCYNQRLFTGLQGEISVRLPDGGLLILPRNKDRLLLQPDDIVYVKDGMADGIPGRYLDIHSAIYAAHSDVQSVITARPASIMGFAAAGVPFDSHLASEGFIILGDVNRIPNAGGRPDAAQIAAAFASRRPVAVVDSLCAVTTGKSIVNAFDRMEVLEFTADAVLSAMGIGPLNPLNDAQIDHTVRALGLK